MYKFPKCFETQSAVKAFKKMTPENFNDLLTFKSINNIITPPCTCISISLSDWRFDNNPNTRGNIIARFIAVFKPSFNKSSYYTKIVTIKWIFDTSTISNISISE
jgi:hypothetical protein